MYYGATAALTQTTVVLTPATPPSGASASASPYDLTTVTNAAFELQLGEGVALDQWLQRVITACSLVMAQYCNRIFPLQTYQDTIFPKRDPPMRIAVGGLDVVQLRRWPSVSPIVSLTENGVALTENTDYVVDYEKAQVSRYDPNTAYIIPWDEWPIVVQYQAGFAAGSADMAVLEDACLDFIRYRYFARLRDPTIRQENVEGVYSASYLYNTGPGGPDDIPGTVAEKINRYRTPVIG